MDEGNNPYAAPRALSPQTPPLRQREAYRHPFVLAALFTAAIAIATALAAALILGK